jgi:hypothetical protein
VDKRIAQTMSYLLRCPRSLVPKAMRACKYTLDESSHPTLQMVIRRSYAKATGGKLKSPPKIIDSAATTTVSPMTNVNRDDNNNADMQQPTSKENQTNDKQMNNEQMMNDQTMNERTTMNKQTDNERSNER